LASSIAIGMPRANPLRAQLSLVKILFENSALQASLHRISDDHFDVMFHFMFQYAIFMKH